MSERRDDFKPSPEDGHPEGVVSGSAPVAAAVQEPGGGTDVGGITREEVERLVAQAKAEAEERAFRRAQGLFDKGQQKVRARLDALELAWQYLPQDQQLSDAQKAAIRSQVIADAMVPDADGGDESGGQDGQEPAQVPPDADRDGGDAPAGVDMVQLIQQSIGVELFDGDPEVDALLGKVTDDMPDAEYYQLVTEAAIAKRDRLARKPESRIPGMAGGGGVGRRPENWEGKRGLSLLSEHYAEQNRARGRG